MRASEVRDAVAAAIVAIELPADDKATADDVFRFMKAGQIVDDMTLQDRMFVVVLDQPPRRFPGLMGEDRYQVTWSIQVAYHDSPEALDRIALDSEQVQWALEALTNEYTDIATADVRSADMDEGDEVVGLFITIEIQYRLTGI